MCLQVTTHYIVEHTQTNNQMKDFATTNVGCTSKSAFYKFSNLNSCLGAPVVMEQTICSTLGGLGLEYLCYRMFSTNNYALSNPVERKGNILTSSAAHVCHQRPIPALHLQPLSSAILGGLGVCVPGHALWFYPPISTSLLCPVVK